WPFFIEADKGHKIEVSVGNKNYRLKKKSRSNGRFDNWIRLEDSVVRSSATQTDDGRYVLKYSLSTNHPQSPKVECESELLSCDGWSVISDIDDTIKDSCVTNRRELLMNTFVRKFQCIEGMAEVYSNWQDSGANFHYVSSSPWQLFDSLMAMQEEFNFPLGTMHLRNFRLRDQFLSKVMMRKKGKASQIKRLIKNLPRHKFLLIGDSGEKDPEIYQKISRKFPNQIKGIFIRDLEDRPMLLDRVDKMRKSAGTSYCSVFSTSDELLEQAAPIVDKLAI
ncbi:MAG: phosphatase domain-containing protein, partial [Planctomycetota bacterium]